MSKRPLSEDESALWRGVTRSIAPLRRRAPVSAEAIDQVVSAIRRSPIPLKTKASPVLAPAYAPAVPPLSPLGRRFRQDVSRGRRAIDVRLDLHGMTQTQAHGVLLGFLRSGQARGLRTALVITGKGALDGNHENVRGVLRRQVPHWLRLPEFRQFVIGFEAAGPGHGGDGALYVSLRRSRMPQD